MVENECKGSVDICQLLMTGKDSTRVRTDIVQFGNPRTYEELKKVLKKDTTFMNGVKDEIAKELGLDIINCLEPSIKVTDKLKCFVEKMESIKCTQDSISKKLSKTPREIHDKLDTLITHIDNKVNNMSGQITNGINLLKMDWEIGINGSVIPEGGRYYGLTIKFQPLQDSIYIFGLRGEVSVLTGPFSEGLKGIQGNGGLTLNPTGILNALSFITSFFLEFGGVYAEIQHKPIKYISDHNDVRAGMDLESNLCDKLRLSPSLFYSYQPRRLAGGFYSWGIKLGFGYKWRKNKWLTISPEFYFPIGKDFHPWNIYLLTSY